MRLVAESVNATFHVSGQLKATEIFYRKEGMIKGRRLRTDDVIVGT